MPSTPKPQKSKRTQLNRRYAILSGCILFLAGLIVIMAVKTTVVDADKWNAKADSLLNKVLFVQPRRGDILADDGTILATNLTRYNINLDYKSNAKNDSLLAMSICELADSMAKYFPRRDVQQWREFLARPLADSAKNRKTCHVLLKDATYAEFLQIKTFPFFREFKNKRKYAHGLYVTPKETRMMPYGSMAKRSIGRCSYRRVAKFEGATRKADSTDVLRGYSGIEAVLDSQLYGKAGTARYVAVTHGMRSWVDSPAVDGYTVRTTINVDMQDIVENELQNMLKSVEADWGTCLLMEVETGDIKAISNLDRDEHGNYIEAMNYALQRFEPGSVMKPISMVVALNGNFASLNQVYQIGRTYAYAGGSPIHDTHSPGALPVSRFIEYSSNIGMTKLIAPHFSNDLNGFRESLRELGFFDKFNTGMAGERVPYFPTLDPKAGGHVSLSRMSYCYSTMIPPLYTCAFYNAIANKGKFVKPRIWKEQIASDGTVMTKDVEYVRDSICSQANAKAILDMLYGVVYGEGGTAKSLRNNIVTVIGKTGTCRIAYESKRDTTADGKVLPAKIGYKEGQYRLAFCGIFPYDNPKYTCMVLISNPKSRSAAGTSGTVVKNVALKMYAHGMLDKYSDYKKDPASDRNPGIIACSQERFSGIMGGLGAQTAKRFKLPASNDRGQVPDVAGMGVREALARIEDAGYVFTPKGSGYAIRQTPAAGTPAKRGQKVVVEFTSR